MRDPKRIKKVLQILRQYWEAHPDLRLGQILVNMADDSTYYMEDDELVERIIKALKEQAPTKKS